MLNIYISEGLNVQQCRVVTLLPSCFVSQGVAFVSFSTQTSQENIFVKVIFSFECLEYEGAAVGIELLVTLLKLIAAPGNLKEDLKNGWADVDAFIFLCTVSPCQIIPLIWLMVEG